MSRNPKYIVTRTPGFALAGTEGRLWVLAENQYARQKNITYYDHAADGKLEQLAAMAQEMNDAVEPKAEAVAVEVKATGDPVAVAESVLERTVGIPTETASEWQLRQIRILIAQSEEGKLNLVSCIKGIRELVGEQK